MSSEKFAKIIVTQPFPGHLKADERKEDPKSWKRTVEREREVDGDPGLRGSCGCR